MKSSLKYAAILGLLILPSLYGFRTKSGDDITPTVLTTPGVKWTNIGTITSGQASFPVDDRSYSAVWTDANVPDANIVEWDVPNDATGLELRFQTKANADAQVLEMWVAAGATYYDGSTEDSFMLGTILTLTGGQQTGPNSNVFVDTITAVDYTIGTGTISDSAANRVAVYRVDLRGYKKVVFIATTYAANTTIYVDARWY